MSTAWRIFIASWKNFARNAWIGIATIFVLTLAILSVNVLVALHAIMTRAIMLLEERIDVTLIFKNNTPEAVLSQARFYLTSLPQVRGVTYRSADEVVKAFQERHKDDPEAVALQEVNGNPLGAQIVIKAKRTEDYPFLLQAMQNPQYANFLEKQTYPDHRLAIVWVERVSDRVRLAGFFLVAIFGLFGLLTAFNAIRVAVYTQREEIKIMRLVGASSSYIRGPFILQGVWFAILATGIAGGIMLGLTIWVEPMLRPFFDGGDPGISLFFRMQWQALAMAEGGVLLFLVSLVSWMAVGKHIRR